jgi:hypothetical protein
MRVCVLAQLKRNILHTDARAAAHVLRHGDVRGRRVGSHSADAICEAAANVSERESFFEATEFSYPSHALYVWDERCPG